MLASLSQIFKNKVIWLYTTVIASLGFVLLAFSTENYVWGILPVLAVGAWWCVSDWRSIFFIMLASIPLCVEWYAGTISTDLPTEPLLLVLTACFIVYFYFNKSSINLQFYFHPIFQILILMFIWYIIVAIFAKDVLVSFKYVAAKVWYILPLVLVTPLIIKSVTDFKKLFWCIFIPLQATIVYTLIKHSAYGFSFDAANHAPNPFYRNHVDYACIISIFFPYLFVAASWYKKYDLIRIWINFNKLLFLFAIFVSYTRTAWLAIFIGLMVYYIVRLKLMKPALIASCIVIALFLTFILSENRYIRFAPDYKKTITHHNLNDHLQSTQTLNDVSSAERIYRWVAAIQMSKAKPILGFGHGGFVRNYKEYAVSAFTTYLSNNIEKSTVHNYFLLVLVEQGIPGFLLLLILLGMVLFLSEKIYHKTINPLQKNILMAVIVSFVIVIFDNMLSDMIEAIKVGTFFYLNIALIIQQDIKNNNALNIATVA